MQRQKSISQKFQSDSSLNLNLKQQTPNPVCRCADTSTPEAFCTLLCICSALPAIQLTALPQDASCEELDESELQLIASGGFLDWYVSDALASGAAPYLSEAQRTAGGGDLAATSVGAGGRVAAVQGGESLRRNHH